MASKGPTSVSKSHLNNFGMLPLTIGHDHEC